MNNNGAIQRMVYDNAVNTMCNAFGSTPKQIKEAFKLTQSFLRLEMACVINNNSYVFQVINGNANPVIFNTEQRLNQQDTFIISEVGFFLGLPSSATDTTFKLLTYPSPFLIANDAQYEGVYNGGQLAITVMNDVLLPAWDVDRHRVSPQTQQTAALGAGSPMDQNDGSQFGYYSMEPNMMLVGSRNIQIKLSLAAGMTAVDANSRFILKFRGFLAQNSTPVG